MTPPDSGEREVGHTMGYCVHCDSRHNKATCSFCTSTEPYFSLPLSLAQRILAALERDIWTELAAELRARLPR